MDNSKKQNILIIGSGGREYAIGWKVKQSPQTRDLYFAPGNGGTQNLGTNIPISATDIPALLAFAKEKNIDLTLALPDDPLALGIVDIFHEAGLRIFGPTQAAAQLESSKAYSKEFMKSHGLPTAMFETFTDFEKAKAYIKNHPLPIVIKASGLALGKGVLICQTLEEATQALTDMLVTKVFGEAGTTVVIEEFMTGPEISTHAFSDGKTYSVFPPAQDHKRVGDGDTGLNTGGMGTITPVPFVPTDFMKTIEDTIIEPTLSAITKEGIPYQGVIYPGLMLTESGPKILEFNARFGDPETQSYMRLLDSDIVDIFNACIDGTLENLDIKWKNKFATTIVLASGGYPGVYEKNIEISGIREAEQLTDVVVFHAGTMCKDGIYFTNGGRVLGVSALGDTLEEALNKAYTAVAKISFVGMQYRKDIGKKALNLK